MVNSNRTIQKAGLTALLTLSMAGMTQSGFAQMNHADSVKTSFMPKQEWLRLRAGAAFHSLSELEQTPSVNLGVEIKPWKNFSVTAGVISNFVRGLYSNQSKYFATPQGLIKENYLCLKYGLEQKIDPNFSVNPFVTAGVRRMKSMAQNAQSDLSPGVGVGTSLECHAITTGQGRNTFLEFTVQRNQMIGENTPSKGFYFGIGAGVKFNKK